MNSVIKNRSTKAIIYSFIFSAREVRSISLLILIMMLVFSSSIGVSSDASLQLAEVEGYTGSLNTEMTIELPQYNGIEPDIRLKYSSNLGNSWLGVGWSMTTPSYISRSSGDQGAPWYNDTDSFYLDGQELIADTSLGGTHSTKLQSYRRIVFDEKNDIWYIWEKNGTKLTYNIQRKSSVNTVQWALSSVVDTRGNKVNYYYWNDRNREYYLDRIEYSGVVIKFHLERRSDSYTYGIGDSMATVYYRLKTIDITVRGQRARAYKLSYAQSPDTQRSVLSSFCQYGKDAKLDENQTIVGGTSFPPMSFAVQEGGAVFSPATAEAGFQSWIKDKNMSIKDCKLIPGDYNGDGRTDIVAIARPSKSSDDCWRSIAVELYTEGGLKSQSWLAAMPDYLQKGGGTIDDYAIIPGDFNGDGKTDLAGLHRPYAGGEDSLQNGIAIETSNGNSFQSNVWAAQLPASMIAGGGNTSDYAIIPGDFNGDGRTDLAAVHKPLSDGDEYWKHSIALELSMGSRFRSETWKASVPNYMQNGGGTMEDYAIIPGDFNGDGKTDIATIHKSSGDKRDGWSLWIAMELSTGSGFVSEVWNASTPGLMYEEGGKTSDYSIIPGDYNGDGKTDLAVVHKTAKSSGSWYTGFMMELSTGSGFVSEAWDTKAAENLSKGSGIMSDYEIIPGDFDADGLTDLAAVYENGNMQNSIWNDKALISLSRARSFEYKEWYMGGSMNGSTDTPADYKYLKGDFNGDGKSDLMTLCQPYANGYDQLTAPSGATGSYSGENVIREIVGYGNTIQLRTRSTTDGYNDEWTTINLASDTMVSGLYSLSGPAVAASGSFVAPEGKIGGIRGNEYNIEFQVLDGGRWIWSSIILTNAKATGYWEGARGSFKYIQKIEGKDNSIIFTFTDNTSITINLEGSNAYGKVELTGEVNSTLNMTVAPQKANRLYFTKDGQGQYIELFPTGEKRIRQMVGSGNRLDFMLENLDGTNMQLCSLFINGLVAAGQTTQETKNEYIIINGSSDGIYIRYKGWEEWQKIGFGKPIPGSSKQFQSSKLRVSITGGAIPDLLVSISNGKGGSSTIQYASSTMWGDRQLPDSLIFPTVTSIITNDGRENISMILYSYQGARYDFSRRLFLGFRAAKTVMGNDHNLKETIYRQNPASIGKPESITIKNSTGKLYSRKSYVYYENIALPYISMLDQCDSSEYNLGTVPSQTIVGYSYDEYGNIIGKKELGDYSISGDERFTLTSYNPNKESYIVGLAAYTEVYKGSDYTGKKLSRTQYIYDENKICSLFPTKGLLTEMQLWNDNTGGYISYDYIYNSSGALVKQIDPMRRETKTIPDSQYGTYIVREAKSGGQNIMRKWDYALGKVLSETDNNGNITSYSYDSLGRLLTKSSSSGNEKYEYLNTGNTEKQRIRKTISDGSPDGLWEEIYTDGLGREWKRIKEGGFIQETGYREATNLEASKSQWYTLGEKPKYTTTAYDGLERITTIKYSDGTSSTNYYEGNGLTSQYDGTKRKKEAWKDAYGRIIKTREWNNGKYSETVYHYDELDRLIYTKTPMGRETREIYDSLGRRLEINDNLSGKTLFEYNELGQLLRTTDAKQQRTVYSYDEAGRLTKKLYSGGKKVLFSYDNPECEKGIGLLSEVRYPDGAYKINAYDGAGNIISETYTIDSISKSFRYTYDMANRLKAVIYPDGERIRYNYDQSGRLHDISGFISAFTYNNEGLMTGASYANGITEEAVYNFYDHSLTGSNIKLGGKSIAAIKYNIGVNPWIRASQNGEYGEDIFDSAGYKLDQNGNIIEGDGRTIQWDYENRPSSIKQGSIELELAYDWNGSRIKKTNESGSTLYFGKLFEAYPNGSAKYIYANGRLIARQEQNGAKYWYSVDKQDSIRLITDSRGSIVNKYDYKIDGSIAAKTEKIPNNRGFCGFTLDTETGLLYTGSRYYDTKSGIFFSPTNKAIDSN